MGNADGTIDLINVDKQRLGESTRMFDSSIGKLLINPKTHTVVAVGNEKDVQVACPVCANFLKAYDRRWR